MRTKDEIVISCFYNSGNSNVPVGFDWASVLLQQFKNYSVTVLLHGQNIPFGLKNSVYQAKYGLNNPYSGYLLNLVKKYGLKIVICDLCLKNDGFDNKDLLSFVKPIPFSIDYIARSAKKGKTIIYDAQL